MTYPYSLADLRTIVRRSLGDFPKVQVDSLTYDGSSNPIPTGKDLPIETYSESFTVNNIEQVRGTNYTIDYDARQVTLLGTLPASSSAFRISYKECVYKTEQIDESINQGRRILFPTIYQRGTATFTVQQNVRDYDLRQVVNEGWARTIFTEGHFSYKIERCEVLHIGTIDQSYVPFRRWMMYDDHTIHLWELPWVGDTFRVHIYYAFKPLTNASDQTDVPDAAIPLVTEWAVSTLAMKQEPMRGRIDTTNVLQGQFASPPGTMMQTSEDFAMRVREIRSLINIEPMVFQVQDIPSRWEIGLAR